MIRENNAKRIMKSGGTAIGASMALSDPAVMEILGRIGFDFIVLNNEHFHYDQSVLAEMMRAAESRGIDSAPMIRVREGSVGEIKSALDMGALGIQIPNVNTWEQAKAIIDATYYPPIGHRGFGSGQHSIGYGFIDRFEYFRLSNSEVLNVLQCESLESVASLDKILSIEEVDVVFVGAMDLSCSMGKDVMGRRDHPELVRVFNDAVKKIVESGKIAGGAASSEQEVKELCDMGVRYLCVGLDMAYIKSAGIRQLDMCRKIVSSRL
jgi:4-hydroxy-2-oxoheptanedioate aldolase